jgi:putative transposase-like DNA-binding protein
MSTCGDPDEAVAIDLGWRARPNGSLRVAMWQGTDGKKGEFVMPAEVEAQIRYADQLRKTRDLEFNRNRDKLLTWIKDVRGSSAPSTDAPGATESLQEQQADDLVPRSTFLVPQISLPDWLLQAASHMGQWRSIRRLALFAEHWKKNRFPGDETAFDTLEAWRYHDDHLWNWEASQRRKGLLHRREEYRMFAARLAKQYGVLVLEEFDLREVAMIPPVEKGPKVPSQQDDLARSNRHVASTSELRGALVNAFRSRGAEVVKVPAQNTTQACHACGVVQKFDAAKKLEWKCRVPECGAAWDQDVNADVNLLERWKELYGGDNDPMEARDPDEPVPETRWERARRMAKEKVRTPVEQSGSSVL